MRSLMSRTYQCVGRGSDATCLKPSIFAALTLGVTGALIGGRDVTEGRLHIMRLSTIILAVLLASSAYAQENDSASQISGEIELFCAHHDLQYDSRQACGVAQLAAVSEIGQRIKDGHGDKVTACMARPPVL